MPEECLDLTEDLLQETAPLPLLSGDLRARVLGAAVEARARRTQGRRVLAGAGGLFALLLCIAWTGPILPSAARLAAAIPIPPGGGASAATQVADECPACQPYSRRERFILAMGDDWRMVEAEFKSREEFTRRVQM
jgi:hypothetical protein